MRNVIVLFLVTVLGCVPSAVDAKGKKGRLNESLSVTRRDRVEIVRRGSTDFVDVDGLTLTVTVDHEAVVVCHGVVGAGSDTPGFYEVGLSVDGVADPEPLPHHVPTQGSVSLPILRSVTFSPGTHVLKVQIRGVFGDGTPRPEFELYLWSRRLVVLVY